MHHLLFIYFTDVFAYEAKAHVQAQVLGVGIHPMGLLGNHAVIVTHTFG